MWSASKNLAYLKVLAALAWADGELGNQELNYLKNLALKFRLPDWAWAELEPCLYDAITREEAQKLLKNFLGLISGSKDKQRLLDTLQEMAKADEQISPGEQEFLKNSTQLIEAGAGFGALTSPFKKLFSKGILSGQKPSPAASDFSKNKILYILRRRIEQGKMSPVEPKRLKYLALFGGLLGRVAYADSDFSPAELNHLKQKLNHLGIFSPHEASLVATVIQEATLKGVDNAPLAANFSQVSSQRQRQELLECLFSLAAADGKVSNEEIEEIRAIATALGFSHKQFITTKLSVLSS